MLYMVVIFFSLTEAPLPDPPNTPKRTRNRPATDPKRTQKDPKRAETEPKRTEIKLSGVDGRGVCWDWGGVGVVREKEIHYAMVSKTRLIKCETKTKEAASRQFQTTTLGTKRERRKGCIFPRANLKTRTVRGLLGTGASPSPPQRSSWHRFDIDILI